MTLKKTEILTYDEGKLLLKYITEKATKYKLSLVINRGLPIALLFTVPDKCLLSEKSMDIILESGILLNHLWVNVSLSTATAKSIFNFVLCPLKFIADQKTRVLVMRLRQLSQIVKECKVTISNKDKSRQLVGAFKLDIFNDYAEQMLNILANSVTDSFLKISYSDGCKDCIQSIKSINYVKLQDVMKTLPEDEIKEIHDADKNFRQSSDTYLKRFK